MPDWHRLGAVDPRSLGDARLQSHWAAQLAATVGRTLLPPRSDDSHASFRWDDADEALAQDAVRDHRSALRITDLWLLFLEGGHVAAEFPLDGRTLRDAFLWIETQAPEPYFYVNHHPVTSVEDLPLLAVGGAWNTRGWIGAILPASQFFHATDQRAQVEEFLRSGIAASRSLIGV